MFPFIATDKLFVVGGSDGCQALCTTEIFDFETNAWSPGPSMTTSRANISVTVIDGKLFAVGGFSGNLLPSAVLVELKLTSGVLAGKVFLNSVEYLDPETMEWTTYVNRCSSDDSRSNSNSNSRRTSQTNLPTVDENCEFKASAAVDSSGSDSDEHSS